MPKTLKGRVVYNRKKHPFSTRDVARIIRKSDARLFAVPGMLWLDVVSELLEIGARIMNYQPGSGSFEGFTSKVVRGSPLRALTKQTDIQVPPIIAFVLEEE